MNKGFVLQSLICLLAVSCSVHEIETMDPIQAEDDVFYASFESYSAPDTKVYLDENIMILWDENDQISIFNNSTLNQKYEFMGKTGDNAGYFKRVTEETGTRADAGYVCAVYPYQESTSLDDSRVLTLTLPEEQTYREGSFGPGANTMVSATNGKNNLLRFKNLGGYLCLNFYAKDLSISSIMLEGRNGEPLSGEATMIPAIDADPAITMASAAGTSISIICDKAVNLGENADEATAFWMVVPPTDFEEGIKLTLKDKKGTVYLIELNQRIIIERNGVVRGTPIELKLDPNKVIYYTSSDNKVVKPNKDAEFGASILSNVNASQLGIMVFDGNVTEIGDNAFSGCNKLTSISIPVNVASIGDQAFSGCTALTSITFLNDIPPVITETSFLETECLIYVPASSIDQYKAAWPSYADRLTYVEND